MCGALTRPALCDVCRVCAVQIHDALEKVVCSSQAAQIKKLQSYHDRRVNESKKKLENEFREANKELVKKGSSKDELSR